MISFFSRVSLGPAAHRIRLHWGAGATRQQGEEQTEQEGQGQNQRGKEFVAGLRIMIRKDWFSEDGQNPDPLI